MIPPVPEELPEQTGPLVRPYISANGQYGTEGDRFWSEELDDMAVRPGQSSAPRTAAPDRGGAAPEVAGGDLLSEEWVRRSPAADSFDPLSFADRSFADRASGAERVTADPADTLDGLSAPEGRRDRDDRESLGHPESPRNPESPESSENRDDLGGLVDGATEPGGFLGSGWRGGEDPEEAEDSRRKGVLLRAGAISVAVVGAIWVLTAWIGQPSDAACPSGGDCAARAPVSSPAAITATEAGSEPDVTPDDPVPTEAVTTAPTTSSPGRVLVTAPPTTKAPASHRPSPKAPATSKPPVVVDGSTESPAPPSSGPTQPTTAPTTAPPSSPPDPPRHDGGLFGWLF
ncbi:hypothetical protein [Planotetraspora sp. GP83]|uniref:hypothetical protein n=1 Tax=Planotetraspora sp. GP83 TaxID=3156264 RepID=UPI003514FC3A